MSENERDPLWGRDTSGWTWFQHVVTWAVFIAGMSLVAAFATWLADVILPF